MMVTPDYCLTMARYNAWQNKQLIAAIEPLDAEELERDRGAFFGSILATANHLLWGDRTWLSRFTGKPAPQGGIGESTRLTSNRQDWEILRFHTDGEILIWAERLRAMDLAGGLSWHSGSLGRQVQKPLGLCIAHMFNHQTHHRGQIHAMLTAAASDAPVSDLAFMPEEGPWL